MEDIEIIKSELIEKLKFNTCYSANVMTATNGNYHLTATIGDFETLYILRDNDDNEVERWKQ